VALLRGSQLGNLTKFNRMYDAFKRTANGSTLRDQWHHLQGFARPGRSARMALVLYEGLQQGHVTNLLRDVARANWGYFVPVGVIQEQLRKAGVNVGRN
jgi:hypothetical protein